MKLGVLKLQVPGISVNSVVDRNELTAKHQAVFKGIGKLKDYQLKLHIDTEVQPVA